MEIKDISLFEDEIIKDKFNLTIDDLIEQFNNKIN